MKSYHLWLCALFATLLMSTTAVGQENRSDMLLHRQPTAIPSETAFASTAPSSTPAFPSFVPIADSTGDSERSSESGKLVGPALTVSSSLAVVLGLFAALVWVTRKFGSRSLGSGTIPSEVLQSLGSIPIDSRTKIMMLRCGSRILVTSQTATGIQPLAEITDPDEVRRLTASCLGDSKTNFATTMQSIEKEKSDAGFLGDQDDQDDQGDRPTPRPRGRLFTNA
jgi:flagellar biogenesis protein FliO